VQLIGINRVKESKSLCQSKSFQTLLRFTKKKFMSPELREETQSKAGKSASAKH